jgi:hypothetical protein
MNRLYDALESCLSALEEGETVETALAGFPEVRAELQPLLQAAMAARTAALTDAFEAVKLRGRARFLQNAAQLREARVPRRQRSIPALPRLAISLSLVTILALTSTGLVSASSGALPGDQLYGIKRSWEDVRLFFVFQPQDRALLSSQFEQERLDEIDNLLAKRQAAPIRFSGLVMKLQDGTWLVSGIPVSVSALTTMPSGPVGEGDPVAITGVTRSDGVVEAQSVLLLQPGVSLPPLQPSEHEGESLVLTPQVAPAGTASALAQPSDQAQLSSDREHSYVFTGVVESIGGSSWRINGQAVYLDPAAKIGSVNMGSVVTFEGYYGADDRFVATKIEAQSNPVHTGGGAGDSGSGAGSAGPPPSNGGEGGGSGSGEGGADH